MFKYIDFIFIHFIFIFIMSLLAIDIGIKNLGLALYDNYFNLKFELINITDKSKYRNIQIYVSKIIKILDNINLRYNLKCILVEKQVLKNRICMMLQSSVLTWCIINNIKYHSFDPKLKFKYSKIKLNTKKKEHKKESVKYAKNIILNLGYSLDYFNTFKKKDDISDAICMIIMFSNEELYKNIIY